MPGSSEAPRPSISFLVFAHRNPKQVGRLAGRIRSDLPDCDVVVRQDRRTLDSADDLPFDLGRVHLRDDGAPTDWGDWSIVTTVMDTLAWSLERLTADWIVCLSGQDYPIVHLGLLEEMLGSSALDGYVSCSPVEDFPFWTPLEKAHRYHHRFSVLPDAVFVHRQVLRAIRVGNWLMRSPDYFLFQGFPRGLPARVGVRRRATPFTADFRCLVGRQWWTLRRATAEWLLEEYRRDRRLREYYRRTLVPDESYFHTVLGNRPDLRLGHDLHHQNWERAERPHTFRAEDFAEVVGSGKFFVRKVDMDVDPTLLDLLDDHAGAP